MTRTGTGPDLCWSQTAERLISLDEGMPRKVVQAIGRRRSFAENLDLMTAVVASPDDDAPRQAYADWLRGQDYEIAGQLAAFIESQLAVARAFRADRQAYVSPLRNWVGDGRYVSHSRFRGGGALRPWLVAPLDSLVALGVVAWPQAYRGFIERVGIRARRFLEIGDELCRTAPIRHLVLTGVAEVAEDLAAAPLLGRIRSISLPVYSTPDTLTDQALSALCASPHLTKLSHLRLVGQERLSIEAIGSAVTAPTLPMLSCLELFDGATRGARADFSEATQLMISRDVPIRVMRSTARLRAVADITGPLPALDALLWYGDRYPDIEAIVENPIARLSGSRSCAGSAGAQSGNPESPS